MMRQLPFINKDEEGRLSFHHGLVYCTDGQWQVAMSALETAKGMHFACNRDTRQ